MIDYHRGLVFVDDHRPIALAVDLSKDLAVGEVVALPAPLGFVIYYGLSAEARTVQHIHEVVLGIF